MTMHVPHSYNILHTNSSQKTNQLIIIIIIIIIIIKTHLVYKPHICSFIPGLLALNLIAVHPFLGTAMFSINVGSTRL